MPNSYLSPLRRAASIDPYTDAEQSLRDNAFASPLSRSFQQAINTDVAGSYRQEALETQLRGDGAAQRAAEHNRNSTLRRMELPAVGPTTFDEARTTGNYGDYVQNVLGSMAGSMVKPLVSASAGGLLGGPLGAAAGGFGGSYSAIRNAELEKYAGDDQLNTLSPEDQLRVTRNSALLQAAPEALMPAYLGVGGRLPGALNRVPTSLRVAGAVGTEGATEGLQDYTSQKVAQNEFPDRQVDWDSVRENAIAGLIGGGAMGVLGRHDTGPEAAPVQEQGPAGAPPMDAAPPGTPLPPAPDDGSGGGGGAGPADTMLGKVAGLGAAVQDRFGEDIAAAGAKTAEAAGKAKDFVSETVDRMTEAVKTAGNPGEFLNKVFGGNIDEEAAADLSGEPNPALKGVTFEETEANIARDDEQRVARAARYAEELLNDPVTPDAIKQRVADMGGDYANPDNQSFVARTLVAQRGGEKITKAVQDLIDLGKSAFAKGSEAASSGLDSAKKAVGDAAEAAKERIIKKNMQDASPAEQAAFGKVIFDGLTDEAKASPLVRAQLAQVTNAIVAFAAKTGDITAKDLPTLTRLSNAMSLFKDPDAMAQQLVEYGAIPRDTDSFLGRIKTIQNARTDIKQPNSFLVSSLSPEAKALLTTPQLQRVAQLVDEFSLQDAAGKGNKILEGLTQAFGTKENAQAVLDYYYQQNRANLRFDPNEGEDANSNADMGRTPRSSDDMSVDEFEGFGKLTEQDSSVLRPKFRTPNPNRPFLKGRDDAALQETVGKGGDLAQAASMLDYVKGNKDTNAKFVAGDIRRDLSKRLNGLMARDKASLEEAIGMYEAHLQEVKGTEAANEVRSTLFALRKRLEKAEDRSAMVAPLREEAKAQERAMAEALKAGKDPDEAMLELYSVAMASESEQAADDNQMLKFRELLDRTSNKGTAAAKEANELIRRTSVPVMIDGKKTAVSLESMIYNSPEKGSLTEQLMASMSLVLGRADVMPDIPADAIVKRNYYGPGKHLLWGGLKALSPKVRAKEVQEKRKPLTPEQIESRAARDKISASGMRSYLKSLPAETDGLEVGVDMLGRVERAYDIALAQIEAFEQEDSRVPPELFEKVAQLASKRRILKTFVKENLDSDIPIDRETLIGGLDTWRQEDGIVDTADDKTENDNILLAEAQMEAYRARFNATKGTSFAKEYRGKAKELADELDNKLSRIPDFKRMSTADRPSGRPSAVRDTPTADPKDAAKTRANLVAELDKLKAQDEKAFRDFVEPDSFSEAQDEKKKLGVPGYNAKYNKLAAQYKADRVKRIEDTLKTSAPRPKAEPGTTRQSTMDPLRGNATSVLTKDEQQKIIDEIVRIRGKDVKVSFGKFADIGGSGEFSMDADKTERLIKIAINSLNPMSVAWHESLHDFMAMLGGDKAERKLKADLLAAAEAPHVMAKLRKLLEGHPKAIEQIESDREERLAYMYQFWAEGLLPLGPTGNNIFSRAARFFREVLGVLSQDQKIEQLLTALHTGKFAEPSLVAAVIQDLKADTLGDKARKVAGPIADLADTMFTGATDRLRDTNIDALTELADMFHREPGRERSGELPFMQRRAQQVGKRLNKLQDILKDTTSEERRRALESMQAMKPASTPLEKELAAYLKEMRDYMVESGVKRFDTKAKKWTDLGNVKDYFPRVWDKETIRNNEAEFVGLMEQYIGKAQARETFNALVNGDGSLELAENEHALGFTPWNPAVLDRQFTFINPSNAADFAKFQSKDMADVMTSYTQRAVHRAEYAHDFGNDGEVITSKFLEAQKQGATPEEIAMALKATMAMEGTLGHDFNPRLKEVMSGIVTYQNIVLLPLSLFSNLIDPLGVAMRSNDMKEAWKAFTYGIKGIADQIRGAGDDAQTEMAKTLGIIDEQNMLEAMGHVYNSMHMSSFLKNINSKFFRYNGMEMWNQRMRVAAMMAAQRFILANLGHERYQSELGITDSDVFQLADGTIALTKDQLLQAGAKKSEVDEIEKRIQAAVFKWVDGAVLRPNAAHRPVWGSDPRYQLIFHLKQFTFSFQNTILRRVGEELKHGNVAPGWILMSYVPFMFLSDVLKGSLTGTLNTTADLYDVASQSIARSGIMGTGVFGADAVGDLERGKLPGTSFLGPAFDHLMTLLSGITGNAGAEQVMNRSVPFAKYV